MPGEMPNPYPRIELPEDEIGNVVDIINSYCQKNGISGVDKFLERYHLGSLDEIKVTISPVDINFEEFEYKLYRVSEGSDKHKLFLKLDRFYEEKHF